MARSHPFRNSLRTCCLCAIALFSAAPGHAQDNNTNVRKVIKKAPVAYPTILKSKGIGGVVRLRVFVKPDGTVRDTEVIGGNPILVESAQKSVLQWKFSQGSSETVMEISVVFDPHESNN
jgi:TonB family protein